MSAAIIVHRGMPCDPPTVDGVTFVESEEGFWMARVTEEQAQEFTRNPRYTRFGGKAVQTVLVETSDDAEPTEATEEPTPNQSKGKSKKG